MDAWVLENEHLCVVTIPQLGAKLVSLLDKRSGREWLAGAGERPLRPVPYGALFHEQDMSGWDEMFPTIVACTYPGAGERHGTPLPDHGEVWTLNWSVSETDDDCLALAVEGRALPYRLARTLTFSAPDTLELRYRLTNLGRQPMPYIWAAHPQFVCGGDAEILFPPEVIEVCNTLPAMWGWGAPETRFGWPVALDAKGNHTRLDRVGPPTLRRGRKVFALPGAHPDWAGVLCRPAGDWLHLAWDAASVPYLGLWVDEGAISHESVVAPEPMTGFYDSLETAWAKQEVTIIEPGATRAWTLRVRLGTGDQSFPAKS
ncbi:MAG: hypothetical protein R6W76_09200 [Caldilinea sp.]